MIMTKLKRVNEGTNRKSWKQKTARRAQWNSENGETWQSKGKAHWTGPIGEWRQERRASGSSSSKTRHRGGEERMEPRRPRRDHRPAVRRPGASGNGDRTVQTLPGEIMAANYPSLEKNVNLSVQISKNKSPKERIQRNAHQPFGK